MARGLARDGGYDSHHLRLPGASHSPLPLPLTHTLTLTLILIRTLTLTLALSAPFCGFQNQCIKMPKELRHWEAYIDLKKVVDDFLQSLPLVQMLAHTSMRSRHWQQLMSLTNKHLAVGSDSFKLIHLLEADLLECREVRPDPSPNS